MNHATGKLSKDEIKRLKFIKKEFFFKILKSIFRNAQCADKYRYDAMRKLTRKSVYLSEQRNFCLLTGRGAGVYKMTNLSRHMMNKLLQQGELVSIKSNNQK